MYTVERVEGNVSYILRDDKPVCSVVMYKWYEGYIYKFCNETEFITYEDKQKIKRKIFEKVIDNTKAV
jgi:hypothetical protein